MNPPPLVVEPDLLDRTPFEVLFVCTANVCRSPMAEHMFRHALFERLGRASAWDWTIRSGGTHAPTGSSMHELTREVLVERGVPAEGAVARQVTVDMLERADLILTANRSQRAWCVGLCPSSVRRVFTMRQFARLCAAGRRDGAGGGGTTDGRLDGAGLLLLASAGRSWVQPVSAEADRIADPIGGGLDDFRRCSALVDACIQDTLGPIAA